MAKKKIYEQREALSAYFNEMLEDSTQSSSEDVVERSEMPISKPTLKQTVIFPSEDIIQPVDDVVPPATTLLPISTPINTEELQSEEVNSEAESAIEQQTQTDITIETPADDIPIQNIVLKILLCDIGGMKVAIKVDALDNIIRWPSHGLSQIPGRKSWEVGLFSDNGQNTNVIDIRTLLHTPNKETALKANYILLVNDRRTGIACDNIEQIINKNSGEINWRHDTSQRPWFTGVLSETMHSILDISAIINALE
ncbi:chemotaxis protein CheW [Methylophaga sulfidovorans]|uniref:Chemotaxis signal transduction protein n=1 Tax=Methylophaga sulfidovorans TaxID=45496 RepID=A0A1I3XI66_9GAMM|nr:chemotaxis protein CheW [Methylophaga sulfidovorans]SFK19202.1 Chemotaxis signal transduction protein [Methylophaga sulfidovorans]